jgi:hypothetical protein
MKVNKITIAIVLLAVMALVILISMRKNSSHPNPSNNNTKPVTTQKTLTANGQTVPYRYAEKAKSLGYYCPSWDAKPGEIAPTICYKLDN